MVEDHVLKALEAAIGNTYPGMDNAEQAQGHIGKYVARDTATLLRTLIELGPDERMEVVASDMDLKRWDLSAGWLLEILATRLEAIAEEGKTDPGHQVTLSEEGPGAPDFEGDEEGKTK